MTRGTGQHKDPADDYRVEVSADRRPAPGPIAILPESTALFEDAVAAGGGTVAALDGDTRGLIWLGGRDPRELAQTLTDHPGIGWVQLPMAGVDAYADVFAEHPVRPLWTSAKGVFSEPVAEHAVALALACLRNLPEKAHGTSWEDPKRGLSIYDRHVVIVGAGGIAKEIMRLLAPYEVEVTVVRRSTTPLDGADRTIAVTGLAGVLPQADVLILAAASTGETARMIGAAELALMKPSAVLVNIARGPLVDTDALVAALSSGAILGAGLDVTDPEPLPDGHPLWNEPRAIITSHAADTPEMTAPLLADRIRANVEAFLGHGRYVGVIDAEAGY